jgi:transposase InsO family protein
MQAAMPRAGCLQAIRLDILRISWFDKAPVARWSIQKWIVPVHYRRAQSVESGIRVGFITCVITCVIAAWSYSLLMPPPHAATPRRIIPAPCPANGLTKPATSTGLTQGGGSGVAFVQRPRHMFL